MSSIPSAILIRQFSGSTEISICHNVTYSQLQTPSMTYIQQILKTSCRTSHLDKIMSLDKTNSIYIIERDKMIGVIHTKNKAVSCVTDITSINDNQIFHYKDFKIRTKEIYKHVCTGIDNSKSNPITL